MGDHDISFLKMDFCVFRQMELRHLEGRLSGKVPALHADGSIPSISC